MTNRDSIIKWHAGFVLDSYLTPKQESETIVVKPKDIKELKMTELVYKPQRMDNN